MIKESRVLILLHKIQHYRVPVFRIIAKHCKLTLASYEEEQVSLYKDEPFEVIFLPIKQYGPIILHKKNIHPLVKKFDVVIGLMNLRTIDILSLPFNPFIKTKIIYWGIGVSASKDKAFDNNKSYDFLRNFLFKRAKALIFYTEYAKNKYISYGFDKKSLFVANNTVEVLNIKNDLVVKKDKLLFVGALHKRKGIIELLDCYLKAYLLVGESLYNLQIIGEGPEKDNIATFIKKNHLNKKVKLLGGVYDQNTLKNYFMSSILCVSPNQAGLSVLTSMGYGVCFVTKNNAITGGEIFNLENNKTGVLYNNKNELINVIIDSYKNPNKYIKIGNAAKDYYYLNRKPKDMAKSIIDSINYVLE
ncbi:glycosyltransferase [Aureibaculum marinum]|uniref:Glycosyltransferase n=1 Tax=Aureibaculum marinum TaxID=2487930 RepID=A0A3N4NE79_9FLAO|nr:glycosyltransferase [Aureibaculum marinum]RPD91726.1 glycosyltransferase [Aureibaculum marinum]